MIRARGLVQTFQTGKGKNKKEVHAVAGVDLDVEEGEVVGFLGPNGAGKTTTLRMLVTLLKPTAGTATVAGYDVVKESVQVRRSIGVPLAGRLDLLRCLRRRRGGRPRDALRHVAQGGRGEGPGALRPARARRAVAPDAEEHVRWPEAAARHRDGPDPLAVTRLPRRADHRLGPASPGQPLGAHPRPAYEAGRDGLPDHALPRRGRRARRPDRDHRQGRDRRERHQRQPQGPGGRRPGQPGGGHRRAGRGRPRQARHDRRVGRGVGPPRQRPRLPGRQGGAGPAARRRVRRGLARGHRGGSAHARRRVPEPDRPLAARRRRRPSRTREPATPEGADR